MSNFENYIHKVCPYCNSKRIKKAIFLKDVKFIQANVQLYPDHHYCENCKRIHRNRRWILDKQQMRRDQAKLKRYLQKNLPRWYK